VRRAIDLVAPGRTGGGDTVVYHDSRPIRHPHFRVGLWDEARLLQIAASQPERNVLAAFESSARQHGIGQEEPLTLYIQE